MYNNEQLPKVNIADRTHPVILYFRGDVKNHPPASIISYIEQHANCSVIFCDSWDELSKGISFIPDMISIHTDVIARENVTIYEFVSMITTMAKYIFPEDYKTKIAAVIEPSCTYEFIKELQSTNIAGVIPSSTGFGVNQTVEAISAILNSQKHWPREIINQFNIKKPQKSQDDSQIKLTDRQTQILNLVCHRGLSNKNIARALQISESTVKVHMSAILKEYGVKNRTQLALAAMSSLSA
jgi:DNA-binding NarL/FixJ family response regulator